MGCSIQWIISSRHDFASTSIFCQFSTMYDPKIAGSKCISGIVAHMHMHIQYLCCKSTIFVHRKVQVRIPTCKNLFGLDILFGLQQWTFCLDFLRSCTPYSNRLSLNINTKCIFVFPFIKMYCEVATMLPESVLISCPCHQQKAVSMYNAKIAGSRCIWDYSKKLADK